MSQAPLAPKESALILDELAEAAPDVAFAPAIDAKPFALGQDSFRPAERLTGLERMSEKLARAIKPAVEPLARMRVQVAPLPLEIKTYGEWQATLPEFMSLNFYRLRPLKGGMLLVIEPEFIAGLVESFYGGTPSTVRRPKTTDFTASEELLLHRLLDKIVGILVRHWREVTPVESSLAGRETNIAHLAFLRPEEPVVLQRFEVSSGIAPTTIAILYPLAMLRPIEEKMAARVQDEDINATVEWRARLGEALEEVTLPVRSVLARPEISVAELLALKPGDVIPINLPPRTPLLAGARRIAEGVIGEQDGRAALRIEKVGNA
jgi:flagellar motor switch protein FliM